MNGKLFTVYLSLGSNIGDRKKNILKALELLKQKNISIIKSSSFYETEPFGFKQQRWFYNIVVECRTNLSPFSLLNETQKIEKKIGKKKMSRWGPRKIDIDIIFYEDFVINTKKLIIPHPMMHLRNFVLVPMNEINPDFVHPIFKKQINQLLKETSFNEKVYKLD